MVALHAHCSSNTPLGPSYSMAQLLDTLDSLTDEFCIYHDSTHGFRLL